MAFPMMCPLPSMPSSSRVSRYPPPPPVGIKLVEKKRWSVKRVLLLLLTAVAGYDFCNEFSLGSGTKGPAVNIAPSDSSTAAGTSWRERSLALLRFRSTRKAPPLPPPAVPRTATATTASTATTTTLAPTSVPASSSNTAVAATIARAGPIRPPPATVTAVPMREVAALSSPRRSSVSASAAASASASVYWQASEAGSRQTHRTATHSSMAGLQYQRQHDDAAVYSNDWDSSSRVERDEDGEDEKKELSVLSSGHTPGAGAAATAGAPYPPYPYLATGLSSPPFVQSTRPWQSPSGFTQLVEA